MDPKEQARLDAEKARQEEIQRRLEADEGQFNDDLPPDPKGEEGGEFTPSPYWDLIKNKLPEDEREKFVLPEGISKENEQEFLDKHFEKIYSKGEVQGVKIEELPPIAREIYEKSKAEENFDVKNFLKTKVSSQNYSEMSDDDIIKQAYIDKVGMKSDDNPDGLTDEMIQEGLSSMNILDKKEKASQLRKEYVAKQEAEMSNYKVDPAARQKQVDDYNKSVTELASKFFDKDREKPETYRKIGGVDIGEEKYQSFKEDFVNNFSLSTEGQQKFVAELFSDDVKLMKVAMFLKYEDEIANALSQKFGEGKNLILDKLDLTPRAGNAGSSDSKGMTEDERKARLEGDWQD